MEKQGENNKNSKNRRKKSWLWQGMSNLYLNKIFRDGAEGSSYKFSDIKGTGSPDEYFLMEYKI
jgi:hypothetical protein